MVTMAITPNKLFMYYMDVKLTDIKKNIGCIVSSYNKNVIERSKRFYVYP